MAPPKRALALLTLPFLVSSPAAADWMAGSGDGEPSTPFDGPGFMFQRAPQQRVDRVYLNGAIVATRAGGEAIDVNLDGGRVMAPAVVTVVAHLGIWRDCNRDGYVGARGAVPSPYASFSTYSAGLAFVDTSICPFGSPYYRAAGAAGLIDGVVDEFLEIGPPSGAAGTDVPDPGARVWGDWGAPGSAHVPGGHLLPFDRGTLDGTHGVLTWIDQATVGTGSDSLGDLWWRPPNVPLRPSDPALEPVLGGGECVAYSIECDAPGDPSRWRDHLAPDFSLRFVPPSADSAAPFALALDPRWVTDEVWVMTPPRTYWSTLDAVHATFYADVSSAAIENAGRAPSVSLPSGRQNGHTYGSDRCPSITSGPSNVEPSTRWECSRTEWQSAGPGPWVGDAYDVRDVDCHDGWTSDELSGEPTPLLNEFLGRGLCPPR